VEITQPFELGRGNLTIDLRSFHGTGNVVARVGIGKLTVIIGEDQRIAGKQYVGLGRISSFGETHTGYRSRRFVAQSGSGTSSDAISLDLSVGVGEIRLVRQPDRSLSKIAFPLPSTAPPPFGADPVAPAVPGIIYYGDHGEVGLLPGQLISFADGSFIAPDGARHAASSARLLPDGTLVTGDGTVVQTDGLIVAADGQTLDLRAPVDTTGGTQP
jgi:hypothetical protein